MDNKERIPLKVEKKIETKILLLWNHVLVFLIPDHLCLKDPQQLLKF